MITAFITKSNIVKITYFLQGLNTRSSDHIFNLGSAPLPLRLTLYSLSYTIATMTIKKDTSIMDTKVVNTMDLEFYSIAVTAISYNVAIMTTVFTNMLLLV